MIKFVNNCESEPFKIFRKYYNEALIANQNPINAFVISSFNNMSQKVSSRFVNLKIIDGNKFIFFSNYNSPKSVDFESHNQIAGVLFWSSINVQIRISAHIKKKSSEYNSQYFKKRSKKKNALAISSDQSKKIRSFDDIVDKYNKTLSQANLSECPNYWGGFELTPYEIEFWEGNNNRLNKRNLYTLDKTKWVNSILQP